MALKITLLWDVTPCSPVEIYLEFGAGVYIYIYIYIYIYSIYRVIHKSLRDFRTRLRNNQDRHGRKEHINIERDTPSFCPTLQMLDMCTLGDAAGS